MFGLGTGELVVVLVVVMLVFGAKRLPELGKGLGQGMRSFKDALKSEDKDGGTPPAAGSGKDGEPPRPAS